MNIAPPGWAKDAIPTVRGWVSPKGELLKSQKIAQEDVDAYLNTSDFVVESEPAPQMLNEAPANHQGLEDYSKSELEALGRQHNIELNTRKSKASMAKELEEHLLS
tara:strand:- start:321 stop:638 length:318 start_codon:yes stop_codon:yes gene_type:complete